MADTDLTMIMERLRSMQAERAKIDAMDRKIDAMDEKIDENAMKQARDISGISGHSRLAVPEGRVPA